MSYLERVKTSRGELLYLVRGGEIGKKFWHYILVQKVKLPTFKINVKSSFIQLDEYGEIIESGWGENPPVEIAEKVKNKYS